MMRVHIKALPRDPLFDEILSTICYYSNHILEDQSIDKTEFGSRDSLKACLTSVHKINDALVGFKAGLGLLERDGSNFRWTKRAKSLLGYTDDPYEAHAFLLGLSIIMHPRVKAFFDMLLDGAKVIFDSTLGRKDFPFLGGSQFENSNIEWFGELLPTVKAIKDKIRNEPSRDVIETLISAGRTTSNIDITSSEITMIWNRNTSRSMTYLCGFGHDLVTSIFSVTRDRNMVNLHLNLERFFVSPAFRDALSSGVGFKDWIAYASKAKLSSTRAALLLDAYEAESRGSKWIPWRTISNRLLVRGLSRSDLQKLEIDIISNPISDDRFILDGEIIIRTASGSINAVGICGQPRYANVMIWR